MNEFFIEYLGLFITISGFIIGLGAVTVIDLHGFFGRTSSYWTEATIRTHKVTKPLIWIGTFLSMLGGYIFFSQVSFLPIQKIYFYIFSILILNGFFLTFYVSPFLINQEKNKKAKKLLPTSLQNKIIISFLVSFTGWWSSLAIFLYIVLNK